MNSVFLTEEVLDMSDVENSATDDLKEMDDKPKKKKRRRREIDMVCVPIFCMKIWYSKIK